MIKHFMLVAQEYIKVTNLS